MAKCHDSSEQQLMMDLRWQLWALKTLGPQESKPASVQNKVVGETEKKFCSGQVDWGTENSLSLSASQTVQSVDTCHTHSYLNMLSNFCQRRNCNSNDNQIFAVDWFFPLYCKKLHHHPCVESSKVTENPALQNYFQYFCKIEISQIFKPLPWEHKVHSALDKRR